MKCYLYETNDLNEILLIKKLLDNADIHYEIKNKVTNIFRNFLTLFLYNVMSSGIDKQKEPMVVVVEKQVASKARDVLEKGGLRINPKNTFP